MSTLPAQRPWLPLIALVLAMALWGSSFVAMKLAFYDYDPVVVLVGRMWVASLCFLVVIRRLWPARIEPGDGGRMLLMAFFEPCLTFLLEAAAVVNTTASQAGVITALLPLMVVLAARVWLKEDMTRRFLTGCALAFVGVVWLSLAAQSDVNAPHPWLGNFYEFLAMVSATFYIVLLKRLSARYNPWFLTAVQAFVGAVFYLPFLGLPFVALPDRWDWSPVLAIVYLGVAVTLGAYGLYNYGVSRLPASRANVFVNLIPVFTVVLGFLVLGERFSGQQFIAAGLVLAGVMISQPRRRRRRGV